jgi:hypothetical protein
MEDATMSTPQHSKTFVFSAALSIVALAGCAGGPYSTSSLRGEYHYNLVQLRIGETTPNIDYCDEHGTITFDGAGGGTGTGTRKCSISGTATGSRDFTYTVNADGEALITEVGETEATRGQLVKRGRIILIDGTTRSFDTLIMHGVAVK